MEECNYRIIHEGIESKFEAITFLSWRIEDFARTKKKKAGHSLEQFIPFEKDYSCWENDDASDIGESCILARSTMHTRDCTIFSRWYDKNWGWDAKMPRERAIIVSRRLIFSFFFLNLAKNATRRCERWEKRKGRQRVSLLNLSLRRKRSRNERSIILQKRWIIEHYRPWWEF